MPPLSAAEIRQLLTAAEWKLYQASAPDAVARLTATQLKSHIAHARTARDKWSDLATRQRREKQQSQGSRVTDAAARSASKTEILSQVLARFEAQLPLAEKAGEKSAKVGKPQRAAGHRATRAGVRSELAQAQGALSTPPTAKSASDGGGASPTAATTTSATPTIKAAKKAAAKKGAARPGGAKKAAKKATAKKAGKKAAKKAAGKKAAAATPRSKKKASAKTTAAATQASAGSAATSTGESAPAKKVSKGLYGSKMAALAASALHINPRDQLKAQGKAKQARIQQTGVTSRLRGHVSARGKRSQGRRDKRG
jgi:hypothetical protein